jgi:hypothetical protein
MANINLKLKDFKAVPLFEDKIEQSLAEQRFRSYLDSHKIESLSDLDTLRSLIYCEIFEVRLQKELNKIHTEGKYPPDRLTGQLTDIQNQKSSLKIKLGIDKTEDAVAELTKLQQLETRFQEYIKEHSNEFTLAYAYTCSKCKHQDVDMVLVNRRVKDFNSIKHPWYAGRFFFNYYLLKMVKEEKISKEDAWKIMCGASLGSETKPSAYDKEYCFDYIDWCLSNWAMITSHLENIN